MASQIRVNIGWSDEEAMHHYAPRFLHALNSEAECRLDKPATVQDVVKKMALPAGFDPNQFELATPVKSDSIINRIIQSLETDRLIKRQGRVLFATEDGLAKRLARDDYWRRASTENYICDEDRPRMTPF